MPLSTLSNKETCIQWYLDQGYTLFPLHGKHPLKGYHWRETTYDPFFQAKENFGVQLGPSDLVVDIDPRNGGNESIKALELSEPSFIVRTGGGGTHLYFKKDAGVSLRKNLAEFKGIDFITQGGYVVGAGSLHPNSRKPYILEPGNGGNRFAPDSLLKILQKQNQNLNKGTGEYVDDDQTKDRYTAYLNQASPAIEGESGDHTTFAVAAIGRDYGLSPNITFELMLSGYNNKCIPPWDEEALRIKVEHAFKYAKDAIGNKAPGVAFEIWNEEKIRHEKPEIDKFLQRTSHQTIKPNLNNTAVIFNRSFPNNALHDLLAFNEFSNNIEFLRPPPWHKKEPFLKDWSDEQAIQCKYWISNIWKFEPNTAIIHEAALKASMDNAFHPVRDYLQGLEWDGHNRCNKWLHEVMGAQDNMYTRAVGLKFLVAAVKRIFEPGCRFQYLLTLEGRQGTFKSTAFEILATRKEWYADPHMDIMNKDSIFMMFGKWIVEMPEMQTHFKAETTAMKGFLSRSTDRARMPYGRITRDFPRQCVFGGTINQESDRDLGWLKDTTGNRRYWPVLVGEVGIPKLDELKQIVHQLWAEAYMLYLQEVPVYLEDLSVALEAENEQAKRLGKDAWQEPIEDWLYAPHNLTQNVFRGEDIYRDCIGGNLDGFGSREQSRLSHVMENLGWVKGVFWNKRELKPKRGYKRPEIL